MASCENKLDPKGVLGFFVYDEKNNVYAVVCKHITDTADKQFFVKDLKKAFAKRIANRPDGESPTYFQNDIEVIKVKTKHKKKCTPIFRDPRGNVKRVRVFEGDVNDYKDRQVFTYKGGRAGRGRVLHSSQVDQVIKASYDTDTHFFVGGDSFADEGDSGRVVAFVNDCGDDDEAESEDDALDLVGIIIHKTGNQTLCLKLHKGLEHLNKKHGLKLALLEPNSSDTDGEDVRIEPGDVFYLWPRDSQ